ncbi:delta-aminolevulinic acid dehydratase [Senna tora]|uniref:Delta-aminolevulinic acid dehydratase n=1 Tax=Senna tora TaxID=362788 RepID=A0A834SXP8_9FABA|nr:delta-aminolevulinic acid dehydratase [Senna tora]
MHPAETRRRYYYQYHDPYYYYNYYDAPHIILDNNNNVYERNPYPFDGPYWDRRMQLRGDGRLGAHPYYDSRFTNPHDDLSNVITYSLDSAFSDDG